MPTQRSATASLFSAVKDANLEAVDAILEAGNADVDARDSSGRTVLMLAVNTGNIQVLRHLVSAGCNLEARHRDGSSALHFAATLGNEGVVHALIEAGAKVNCVDTLSNTPLLLAAVGCRTNSASIKVMKHLIDAGCDLEMKDAEGRTALHYTCYRGVGAELLLSAGAQPDVQDLEGNAPIHMAAIEGFDPVICCLTTYNCNPNLINHAGKMAVHYLAMKGHSQAIEDIANIGGYLDHPDLTGRVPLWYAVIHCRDAAVKSLLRSNCSPDPPNHVSPFAPVNQTVEPPRNELFDGEPAIVRVPIHAALQKRFYGIAQQLVLAGCILDPLKRVVTRYFAGALHNVAPSGGRDDEVSGEREAMQWFSEWVGSPPTLKQTCRVRIRECMRPAAAAVHGVIGTLTTHLPEALKGYVNLSELEDFTREGIFE